VAAVIQFMWMGVAVHPLHSFVFDVPQHQQL
jgi:hypothetical protein